MIALDALLLLLLKGIDDPHSYRAENSNAPFTAVSSFFLS